MLTLHPENEKYIIMQRSDMERVENPIRTYLSDVWREYETLKPFLPERLLAFADIGCGMGGLAMTIAKNTGAKAYLVDSDGEIDLHAPGKRNGAGFHEDYVFYSNRDLLAQNFADNGLSCALVVPGANLTEHIDFAISTLSCGFHYPVETYRSWFEKNLRSGGRLILDIRVGLDESPGPEFKKVGLVEHFKRFNGTKHKADRTCWERI